MDPILMAAGAVVAIPGAVAGARALGRRATQRGWARRLQRHLRAIDEEAAALQRTWSHVAPPTDPAHGEETFLRIYRSRHAHPVLDSLVASGALLDLPDEVRRCVRDARAALLWLEEMADEVYAELCFGVDEVELGSNVQGTFAFLQALDEVDDALTRLRRSVGETGATAGSPRRATRIRPEP